MCDRSGPSPDTAEGGHLLNVSKRLDQPLEIQMKRPQWQGWPGGGDDSATPLPSMLSSCWSICRPANRPAEEPQAPNVAYAV